MSEGEKTYTRLIDKETRWECPECGSKWLKDCRPQHQRHCSFHLENMRGVKAAQEFHAAAQKLGEDIGAFGPDPPLGMPLQKQLGAVVPIYGWVCSRCNRVYAPGVSECPHCQPPWGCGNPR